MDWLDQEIKEKLADLKLNSQNLEGNEVYNLERKLVIESEKRLKYVENMVRLRGRFEKGICSFATRFFRKDDPKKIASKKELDKY